MSHNFHKVFFVRKLELSSALVERNAEQEGSNKDLYMCFRVGGWGSERNCFNLSSSRELL